MNPTFPSTQDPLREEFETLAASFESVLAPSGPIEAELVRQLSAAAWSARRCARIERLETNPRLALELGSHRERNERCFQRAFRALAQLRRHRPQADIAPARGMARDLREALIEAETPNFRSAS
jgi:hypothetical protein